MTDSHPAKGQGQEHTSRPDKTAYAVAGGTKDAIFLSFAVSTFLWLDYFVSKRREREGWQEPVSSVRESKLQFLQRPK